MTRRTVSISPIHMAIEVPPQGLVLKLANEHMIGTLLITPTGLKFKSPKSKKNFEKEVTWGNLLSLMRSGLI